MDQIELFDKYISGELSTEDRIDFEKKLAENNEFSTDFTVYKSVVKGIIKEEEEKEREIELAFKNIDHDELLNIIGYKATKEETNPSRQTEEEILQKKKNNSKTRIISLLINATSIAAVAILTIVLSINNINYNKSIDNMLFEYNCQTSSRSTENIDDLSNKSPKELEQLLPSLTEQYKNATDEQEIGVLGINIAMINLKLHDREKAIETLCDVKSRCKSSTSIINKCNRILKYLN
ncbi:MAG: hypothetical protein SPE05_08760 [Bacteroidales bacterium]|nr:hypothetical protein [Bacteroidales bacterium]